MFLLWIRYCPTYLLPSCREGIKNAENCQWTGDFTALRISQKSLWTLCGCSLCEKSDVVVIVWKCSHCEQTVVLAKDSSLSQYGFSKVAKHVKVLHIFHISYPSGDEKFHKIDPHFTQFLLACSLLIFSHTHTPPENGWFWLVTALFVAYVETSWAFPMPPFEWKLQWEKRSPIRRVPVERERTSTVQTTMKILIRFWLNLPKYEISNYDKDGWIRCQFSYDTVTAHFTLRCSFESNWCFFRLGIQSPRRT